MAIIKSIGKTSKAKNGVKKVLEYVGKKCELSAGINCSDDFKNSITEFQETKKLYNKFEGRQYKHIVQSFKEGEVTPEKALEIGIEFSKKAFKGYEVFIATHTDRNHIHNHIVLNSVSMENGRKYHEKIADLYNLKKINNEICQSHGLSIPEKNREQGKVIAWNRNKYEILKRGISGEKESDSLNLARTILKVSSESKSKDEFVDKMQESGYKTEWNENRKHIVFEVEPSILKGKKNKFRLATLNKTFNHENLTVEGLENEFSRTKARDGAEARGVAEASSRKHGVKIEYKDTSEFVRELEKGGDRKGDSNSIAEEILAESDKFNKRSSERDIGIRELSSIADRRDKEKQRKELERQQRTFGKGKSKSSGWDIGG